MCSLAKLSVPVKFLDYGRVKSLDIKLNNRVVVLLVNVVKALEYQICAL